eukprot:65408_1
MAYTAFRDLCNAHRNGIGKSVARGYAYAIRNFLMKNDGSLDVTAKAMPRLHGIWSSLEKKKPTKGAKALNNSIVLDMFKFLNENIYDDCIWRATYAFAHNAVKRPNQYTTLKPVLSQLTWNGSCPGWKERRNGQYSFADVAKESVRFVNYIGFVSSGERLRPQIISSNL